MAGNFFIDKKYGPITYYKIVGDQLIPAILPFSERAEGNQKPSSGQGGEKVPTGRFLRFKFGKDRPDLVKSDLP
jgi:hypothetical protein